MSYIGRTNTKKEKRTKCYFNVKIKQQSRLVVSTVGSGILLALFSTVKSITAISFISYDVIVIAKKFQWRRKVNFQADGAINFLALFHQNHIHCQQLTMGLSCNPCGVQS